MYAFSSDSTPRAGRQEVLGPQDPEALGQELTTGLAGILIRRTAFHIASRLGLPASEREELEQDLRLQLIRRFRHFDAKRAPWHSFVTAVVDRCGLTLWRRLGRLPCTESLDVVSGDEFSPSELIASGEHVRRTGARSRSDLDAFGLEHDVAEVVAQLEAELVEFCEKLKEQSVAQAARELDIPRSTFRDRLERVREIFADHDLDKYL